VAADGRVLDATRPLGSTRLLTRDELAAAHAGPTFADRPSVPGLDEPARLLAIALGDRVLVVGATRENRAETLRSLRAALLVGGPVALLLASLGGYLLAGAALRPIEAMRCRADEISASSLHERLPVAPAGDEVARLGVTLNAMLARLEEGLARERRFVADASHELRTPLALLRTELELALRRERTPEALEAAVRSAAAETERLTRIAEDLLVLARSDRSGLVLQLAPTDVADLLHAVAARSAQAGGEVTVEDGPALVASLDRVLVEQALGNLVDNAIRHGGGRASLGATASDGTLELRVVDEGPGFPPAFLERALEPFSRAAEGRGGQGTGLGLAIVESVARAHGGSAHVANREGGGADASIRVPLVPTIVPPPS
jgi:signal transduction histidine kinase